MSPMTTTSYIDPTFIRLTGTAFRDQICNMVVDHMQHSEHHFWGIRSKWPRLYDLWRGNWSGRYHPHKNNVHIPLIFSAIWADAARKVATSLAEYPVVSFLGYGPDDMPIARKREALVSAQMKDDKCFLKQVDTVVSADLYGVAVLQIGWKKDQPMRIVEYVDRAPLSGKLIRHIKKQPVTMFDGPETMLVDLLDFFPQPCVARLDQMKWVVRRYFLDLDDLRFLASTGAFDKNELRRLEMEGAVGKANAYANASLRRFQVRTGMDDETARFMDKYSRPIEILEMWGNVPSEYAPDGVLQRVITVANRRYLMRNRPNPYNHGLLPFVAFTPTPDMHYFYAPGKAEVVEKIQIVANRYLNQSLDAADLMIDPMWFYNRAAGLVTKNLYARPGKFIPVNGNPGEMIQPVQHNVQGLTIANDKIAEMRMLGNMGTGIQDDVVAGLKGDSRQTAREFVGRREAAGTRLLLESRIYEEMLLEPMANMFVALDKQFLELPVEVLILGDGALLDPVTQTPVPGSRERLSGFDLTPNYAARALGASVGLSKGMQQQALVQLLQAMGTPLGQAVMGQVNVVNFWRSIFRAFDVPNINEIFAQDPRLKALLEMNEARLLGGGGGVGGLTAPQSLLSNVPTSGQIAGPGGGGIGPLAALGLQSLPGMPPGSAQSLLTPPNLAHNLPQMAA